MKIAIVTAVFAPSSTPRALRATELAKEFGKQGHSVTVFNCTKIVGDEPPAMENVEYIDLNIRTLSNKGVITNIKRSKFTVKIFNCVKNGCKGSLFSIIQQEKVRGKPLFTLFYCSKARI